MTDYLDVDPVLPPNQRYGLLTTVYGESNKFALKLRGAFETKEEATKFCERLNKMVPRDQQTPTYVVDLGSWLCMPPPTPEEVTSAGGEEVYQEEFMQNLMKGYRENQAHKDQFFAERKQEVMQNELEKDSPHPSTSGKTLL